MPPDSATVIDRFNALHERYYGFSSEGERVEIVNIRLTAIGRLAGGDAPETPKYSQGAPEPKDTRLVWYDMDEPALTPVYDRDAIAPGVSLVGPVVIEQLDSTTIVFPGDRLISDNSMNLIISVDFAAGGSA